MKGIHCALQGRLGPDVELRRSERGKDWCRLSVGVGEGDEVTWVSDSVFEEKARALEGLRQGRRAVRGGSPIPEYVDRQGRSNAHRAGSRGVGGNAARPDRTAEAQSRDEYERPRDEQDAVPFDDLLRF
jgi:hypothetical protein